MKMFRNIKQSFGSTYNRIINYLSQHKSVALFFSHGGLHIVVLLCLVVSAISLYIHTEGLNKVVFRQMNVTISDTLRNHNLTSLYLYKAMTPRKNSKDHGKIFEDFFLSADFQLMKHKIRNDNANEQNLLFDSVYNRKTNLVAKIVVKGDQYGKEEYKDSAQTEYIHHLKTKEIIGVYSNIERSNKKTECYYSPLNDRISHQVIIKADILQNVLKCWDDDNPFYCFWIGIKSEAPVDLDYRSAIEIQFNLIDSFLVQQPTIPDKVVPEPSEITPWGVIYKGKEKVEAVLKNGGIFISGVDPAKKSKADKTELLYTVLMGTIITFSLDIFVQLILKWRKLSRK